MQFKNIFTGCAIAIGSCFAVQTFAQTITTGTISSNDLCLGDTVYVPFTTTGTFQQRNIFIAQLSDAQGSFTNIKELGSTSNAAATYITAIVPSDIASSSQYRIRVISTTPYVAGADNGSDIYAGKIITTNFGITTGHDNTAALTTEPVTFYINAHGGGAPYSWNFGDGASPQTSTDSAPGPVSYSTPGEKTITLTALTSGCKSIAYTQTNYLAVYSCDPAIPSTALIDSTSTAGTINGNIVWVVPGGTLNAPDNQTVLVEPGGNVNIGTNDIVYLKAGATCYVPDETGWNQIIYTDGAGISYGPDNINGVFLLKCSSLNFDYTNAPPYHLPTTGVHEGSALPISISIYPNPANDILNVFTGATMPTAIRLFNTLGEQVWSAAEHATNNVQIATDNLENGVYYLQVTAPGKMSTEKVTVIH